MTSRRHGLSAHLLAERGIDRPWLTDAEDALPRGRQGYARAALVTLLDRAAREPAVHTVRATVRPDNIASRNLILQYGFVEVGEQWDDEDGPEIVDQARSNAPR